jgi:hypothetical protein
MPILISKIDNPAPGSKKRWEQWELDSITPHQCNKKGIEEEIKAEETRYVQLSESIFANYTEAIKKLTDQVSTLNFQLAKLEAAKLEVRSSKK